MLGHGRRSHQYRAQQVAPALASRVGSAGQAAGPAQLPASLPLTICSPSDLQLFTASSSSSRCCWEGRIEGELLPVCREGQPGDGGNLWIFALGYKALGGLIGCSTRRW